MRDTSHLYVFADDYQTHLIPGAQPVHGADLVRRQRLSEEVDRRHLTAEDPFFVQFRCGPDVAFVEGLWANRKHKFYPVTELVG